MATIAGLPVELKEAIFAETTHHDLNNLSKTCKSIRAVALPALFRNIAFMWDANTSDGPPITALLRCILDNPDLAKLIKHLQLQAQGYRGFSLPQSSSNILLPTHTHCITPQDWQVFEKPLQVLFSGEGGEVLALESRERNLNVAIAILIANCTCIEMLRMDIELLVNNHSFPELLRSTLRRILARPSERSWLEKLVHVVLTCGTAGQERRYVKSPQVPANLFLYLFYLPAVKKLDLTLFPNLSVSQGIQEDTTSIHTIWPFPQAPIALNLTTLQLRRSPVLPSTLDLLLAAAPNLTTLDYDCLLPSSKTPLCLSSLRRALNRIRKTLEHLSVRCEVFSDDATEVESIDTVLINNLGSLRDFPALTTVEISLAVLYGQVREVNFPLLKDLLPRNLHRLTINDDLWGFYAFIWEGLEVMEVLKKFLTGQRKNEAYWDDVYERWVVTWVDDGEAGWRESTPSLKEFVLDLRRRGWSFYDFWDDTVQKVSLQQACDEQGISCEILCNT